jgi:protease-4
LGLVDELGGLDDAIAAAAKLAKIDDDYHAVYLEPEPDQLSEFLNGLTRGQAAKYSGEYAGGYDVIGRLSLARQASAGRFMGDMQRLLGQQGVQAECLECAGLTGGYRPDARAEGWFAKWAEILATR